MSDLHVAGSAVDDDNPSATVCPGGLDGCVHLILGRRANRVAGAVVAEGAIGGSDCVHGRFVSIRSCARRFFLVLLSDG